VPFGGGGLLQLVTVEGTQLAASPAPVPVQVALVQVGVPLTVVGMHWPLGHWLSAVHRHAVPAALHMPLEHEYAMVVVQPTGSVCVGSWQPRSFAAPVPVQVAEVQPS